MFFNDILSIGMDLLYLPIIKSKKKLEIKIQINIGDRVMSDKILVCKDCSVEFPFTESEQAFYKEKGFENEPQRCSACRKLKKQQRNGNSRSGGYNNNKSW